MVICLFSGCRKKSVGEAAGQTADGTNKKTYTFTAACRADDKNLISTPLGWFAKEIESKTDGRIKINIQYNGVLGSQGTEFEMLENGICDIAVASLSSNADKWPSLTWVIVPGMVDSYTSQLACLKAVKNAGYLDADFKSNDCHLMWWQPLESFNYGLTNKKVESLADFKGLKIGYAGGEYIRKILSNLGATAVGTNAGDFYLSLSTGVLDGFVNPARYMYDAQFYEVVKYMPIGITAGGSNNSVYISNRAWNSLPEDLQKVFTEVCTEAEQLFVTTAEKQYSDEYNLLNQKGCECYALDPDLIATYADQCKSLSNEWVKDMEKNGHADASAMRDLVHTTISSMGNK